ncbi:hypothetical protein P350_10850 [Burkholderia cepacia JBK9]|nr:hypothetical protein P350_10850 [Burkholderia cepacia JBK9]
MSKARKTLLPHITLCEVTGEADPAAKHVVTPRCNYFTKPIFDVEKNYRIDNKPGWKAGRYNLFPVVLGDDGAPWAEATVYILSRLENSVLPNMATYSSIADDLAAYRRFLDESKLDWMVFPRNKFERPTYRYHGHLKLAVEAGKLAASTAKRRMGNVIAFYTWLRKSERVFEPEHEPWKESDRYIDLTSGKGFRMSKRVTTTDISIAISKQDDPYDGVIEDGGKLRPLPTEEQEWLVDALLAIDNTEMTLIHLFSMLTGARIQSVLTCRVKHALLPYNERTMSEVRIPAGLGTGIDTKFDKNIVLHVPIWFQKLLRIYAFSERARKRRHRAVGGDTEDQYLFLSIRGAAMYRSKQNSRVFDEAYKLKHGKNGQGVREFIDGRVIPYIREHNHPSFSYRFHDLRATCGMNATDSQLKLVEEGETTLYEAREYVRTLLSHESSEQTERYLKFRERSKLVRKLADDYDRHLRKVAERAMERVV